VTSERVFVVERRSIPGGTDWHGVRTHDLAEMASVLEARGRYEDRAMMEIDPTYKQVIPYLVLRDGDAWFLMRRTAAGGDARLHGRYSIGVGGHLNPGDDGLLGGLRREWAEELVAAFVPKFHLVGFLNDETTEVGAVHIGAIYIADAAGRPVAVRETDKLTGGFASTASVAEVADGLETWSRIVFDFLVPTAIDRTRMSPSPDSRGNL
jgi:predicted NUDIX family phosphoesterase